MKIHYVGPRPEISKYGVFFKLGKEDKYIYLVYAIDILVAIDKKHNEKTYTYPTPVSFTPMSDDQIYQTILKYEPDIDKNIQNEIDSYSKNLDREILEVKERKTLSDFEKEIYLNNLKLMREYRVQRAINKIVYIHIIDNIIKIIKREKIKELRSIFCDKFWHIHHTIENHLFSLKSPLRGEFKVLEDPNGDKMIAKLDFSHGN